MAALLASFGASVSQAEPTAEPYVIEGRDGATMAGELVTLMVPENRGVADSRSIPLRYVRLPATTDEPGFPIVYLAGGPGGSAVGAARGRRFGFFRQLRDVGDVILLEQRGAGLSIDIEPCETEQLASFDGLISRARLTAAFSADLARCIANWQEQGVDIAGYNSEQNARDLEDLRQALGVEKLNLVAISYGTHLGMTAVRQGLAVDRMVFAGLEGPDQTVKLPTHFDAYFDRVIAALEANPAAHAAYPDLRATMTRVHQQLDVDPVAVSWEGRDGDPVTVETTGFAVQLLVSFGFISDPANVARLPAFYAQLDGGDTATAARMLHGGLSSQFSSLHAMPVLMDLASGISPDRLEQVVSEAPDAILGDTGNFPMPQLAGFRPALDLGESFRADFTTAVPALIIVGSMDGRTPVESQQEIIPFFTAATVLEVENGGHNIFEQSEEVRAEIVSFLRTGQVSTETITLPPVPFFVPE
jgi:pimeloyl-ACP methyl ester carboxylesterase